MSKHRRYRGNGRHRAQAKSRRLVATAVAVGGAGLVLSAPAAALLAMPGEAHAAPLAPTPNGLFGCIVGTTTGDECLAGDSAGLGDSLTASLATAQPFLDVAGGIPIVNIFIGNGADGTAAHPNGFNGGLLIGNGGNGFNATGVGASGGAG